MCLNLLKNLRDGTQVCVSGIPQGTMPAQLTLFTKNQGGSCARGGWCFHFGWLASEGFTSSTLSFTFVVQEDSYNKCLAVKKKKENSSPFDWLDLEAQQVPVWVWWPIFQKAHWIQWYISRPAASGVSPLERRQGRATWKQALNPSHPGGSGHGCYWLWTWNLNFENGLWKANNPVWILL